MKARPTSNDIKSVFKDMFTGGLFLLFFWWAFGPFTTAKVTYHLAVVISVIAWRLRWRLRQRNR